MTTGKSKPTTPQPPLEDVVEENKQVVEEIHDAAQELAAFLGLMRNIVTRMGNDRSGEKSQSRYNGASETHVETDLKEVNEQRRDLSGKNDSGLKEYETNERCSNATDVL